LNWGVAPKIDPDPPQKMPIKELGFDCIHHHSGSVVGGLLSSDCLYNAPTLVSQISTQGKKTLFGRLNSD
jgi:hypothetical protein